VRDSFGIQFRVLEVTFWEVGGSYRQRFSIENFLAMKFTTQHDLYQ
jgi:hypothetical protein